MTDTGTPTPAIAMTMLDGRKTAVTGVVPPQLREAIIRETWPGVTDVAPLAALAKLMARSVILAPLAWLPLALTVGKRITPGLAKRYTLTNRRLMIRRGLKPTPSSEVALSEIEDVRLADGSYDEYFRTGDLEVIAKGQVAMTLEAVPEPEAFRRAILQAKVSWGKVAAPAEA